MICFLFCAWHYVEYRAVCKLLEQYEQEREQLRQQPSVNLDVDSAAEEEEEEALFTVLNRAPDYLRDTAISYARRHDLGESVSQLYSKSSSDVGRSKRVSQKRRRPVRRRHAADGDYGRWATKSQAEPIFDLPIDKNSFWLSSPFGIRRTPRSGRQFHFGIDMAAVRGTPVKAAGDGVVVQASYQAGYGNVVVIKHDGKFKTRYAHLSKILIRAGTYVKAGDVIGKVGSTGNARASGKTRDASHLHFEVEMHGKRVNPFYFFK